MDDFNPVTYREVNDAWRTPLPPVTAKELTVIFRRLVAKFGGRNMRTPSWSRRLNRSWANPKGSPHGGPGNGLPVAVHDASHWVHEKLHPLAKTHCAPHAALEKAMAEHVIAKGWHQPRPKPVKAKTSPEVKVAAAIKRWETKAKRAATALRKLNAEQRRLERRALKSGLAYTVQAPGNPG